MEKLLAVNPLHVHYFRPLLKWRILDLSTLIEEFDHDVNVNTFLSLVNRWERKGILKSFKDPYVRRKYIYFSKEAEEHLLLDDFQSSEGINHIWHDAKVSEVTRGILEMEVFEDAVLESELKNKESLFRRKMIFPDALINGVIDGERFNIALELELTRKSKSRIIEKGRRYDSDGDYDYTMFLFPHENVMRSYYQLMIDEVGSQIKKHMMFFCSKKMFVEKIDLKDFIGFFNGNECSFYEVFSNR